MMMRHRGPPDRDELLVRLKVVTANALAANPPVPFGRIRTTYVSVVAVLLVATVGFDLLLGQTRTALLGGSVILGAIGIVVGAWRIARARNERNVLSGIWLACAITILKGTDDSLLEVSSLRILAAAENSAPPLQPELDEIAAQMERATPARAAAMAAYLRLRAAAYDTTALKAAVRTMRDPA